jgi:predicted Zn-dependent protease
MDRLLTKTLAEIYLQQGHLQEAYSIFKALAEKNPSDMDLQNRVAELEQKLALASPATQGPSTRKKIQTLERWLTSLRDRRRD